ncbi:hypothetical protein AMECASPLE_026503 [Ameca splendens]|uniref:Uncharacterized protein n=1 Tax=Ameca splendens TaxID=208324 RepID=A0ABV0Y4U3_9TELE
MWLRFGRGAGQLAWCGGVGGRHPGAPPGFGCGVGGVPRPWHAVVAFLQCFLLGLLPLAGRRAAVGGRVGGVVEHVLCPHWGGCWDALGLEQLACTARLPGWYSHRLMPGAADGGRMVGQALLAVVAWGVIRPAGQRVAWGAAACGVRGLCPLLGCGVTGIWIV